jgi:hypothetical protein
MAAFVVFENAQAVAYKWMNKSTISDTTQTAVDLGSGLLAGFAAALVSQPADTMLSKINKTSRLPGEATTTRLLKIAKELGLRGSYSGIGPRLVMVGGMGAAQFAIYGSIKKVCVLRSTVSSVTNGQGPWRNWRSRDLVRGRGGLLYRGVKPVHSAPANGEAGHE